MPEGGPEDHGKYDAKCVVKPREGIISEIGVAIKRGCDPGVCQLQQRSPARPQKLGRLPIDLPTDKDGPKMPACGSDV
jgi:hypothetical protein